jgi:hypothetical protein
MNTYSSKTFVTNIPKSRNELGDRLGTHSMAVLSAATIPKIAGHYRCTIATADIFQPPESCVARKTFMESCAL